MTHNMSRNTGTSFPSLPPFACSPAFVVLYVFAPVVGVGIITATMVVSITAAAIVVARDNLSVRIDFDSTHDAEYSDVSQPADCPRCTGAIMFLIPPPPTHPPTFLVAVQAVYTKPWMRLPPYFIGVLLAFGWLYVQQRRAEHRVQTRPMRNLLGIETLVLGGWAVPRTARDHATPCLLALSWLCRFVDMHTRSVAGVLPFRVRWWMTVLVEGLAVAVLAAVVFGATGTYSSVDNPWDPATNVAYTVFTRPAWGLAVAAILLICFTQQATLVNTLLGAPVWQPLAKLTYGAGGGDLSSVTQPPTPFPMACRCLLGPPHRDAGALLHALPHPLSVAHAVGPPPPSRHSAGGVLQHHHLLPVHTVDGVHLVRQPRCEHHRCDTPQHA